MEILAKPGVGGIIEKNTKEGVCILVQERFKEDAPDETGLIEIPAGKVRAFESIYDCLRREIKEETGLEVVEIEGERDSAVFEANGYKAVSYTPFANTQNVQGSYPIMVQIFICKVTGDLFSRSDESRNIRWILLEDLKALMEQDENKFYPMHVNTLKKYLKIKLEGILA